MVISSMTLVGPGNGGPLDRSSLLPTTAAPAAFHLPTAMRRFTSGKSASPIVPVKSFLVFNPFRLRCRSVRDYRWLMEQRQCLFDIERHSVLTPSPELRLKKHYGVFPSFRSSWLIPSTLLRTLYTSSARSVACPSGLSHAAISPGC